MRLNADGAHQANESRFGNLPFFETVFLHDLTDFSTSRWYG